MSGCIQHGTWGDYCGPECARLTKYHRDAGRKGLPYQFRGRNGDTYAWSRESLDADFRNYEEVVTCNVDWFWGKR